MKIKTTKVKAKDLQPGDLFSTGGPGYWDNYKGNHTVGERVFIRTEEPCPVDQEDVEIFRIEVE